MTVQLLLVEDSEADALLVERLLEDDPRIDCNITHVDRLSAALERLEVDGFDLVIFDLSLPDSVDTAGVEELRERFPVIPIVVLTGNDDQENALRALHAGAQDYLTKADLDRDALARSIRYSLERHRLQQDLDEARRRGAGERELQAIGRLSDARQSLTSAAMLNQTSLRAAHPERFSEFVRRFAVALDVALEQRAFKVDAHLSDRLRDLAELLGAVRAGPRDVIEVYREAVASKVEGANALKLQAYLEEARLLALELMGNLVSCYRPYSIGAPRSVERFGDRRASQPAGS